MSLRTSSTYGKKKGNRTFNFTCPGQGYAVKINGYSNNDHVNRIGVSCNNGYNYSAGNIRGSSWSDSDNNGFNTANIYYKDKINGIRFKKSNGTYTPYRNNKRGNSVYYNCPGGYKIAGFQGTYGDKNINQLKVTCRKPNPDYDQRADRRCGPSFSNSICGKNRCCSAGGYCGTSDAHCYKSPKGTCASQCKTLPPPPPVVETPPPPPVVETPPPPPVVETPPPPVVETPPPPPPVVETPPPPPVVETPSPPSSVVNILPSITKILPTVVKPTPPPPPVVKPPPPPVVKPTPPPPVS